MLAPNNSRCRQEQSEQGLQDFSLALTPTGGLVTEGYTQVHLPHGYTNALPTDICTPTRVALCHPVPHSSLLWGNTRVPQKASDADIQTTESQSA